ncbi:MAG: DUF2752 domain-containing protein [Pygmaiobacter massiliensis]
MVFPLFLLAAWFLYREGHLFPCYFYQTTGFYCLGCGGSRAVLALMHGNFTDALRYNAFVVLLLPFLAYFLLSVLIETICGRRILRRPKLPGWAWICLALVAAAFTIIRNLPFMPRL